MNSHMQRQTFYQKFCRKKLLFDNNSVPVQKYDKLWMNTMFLGQNSLFLLVVLKIFSSLEPK